MGMIIVDVSRLSTRAHTHDQLRMRDDDDGSAQEQLPLCVKLITKLDQ